MHYIIKKIGGKFFFYKEIINMKYNVIKPEIFMKANNSEKDPKKYADE